MVDLVYIDDEPALLRAIQLVFEDDGLSFRGFQSPREAITFIAENQVRAVLCDYRMPEMTGIEVLQALDRNVYFFLVSGDLNLASQLGNGERIEELISKPFDVDALVERIKNLEPKSGG